MDTLNAPIAALHSEGRLRVWSLVITVFGDAVRPRGGRIATAALQDMLGRLGVTAGALRTALSRLTADGWLIREREGRASFYRLSARGVAEFGPASLRIYAGPDPKIDRWTIAMGVAPAGATDLGGGMWLSPGDVPSGATPVVAVTGDLQVFSEAGRAALCPPDLRMALRALWADLDFLADRVLDPGEAMAARVLLIHRWRRIVLRWSSWPVELLPQAYADADPRKRVAYAYRALLGPSEQWLDTVAALPAADPSLHARFAGT